MIFQIHLSQMTRISNMNDILRIIARAAMECKCLQIHEGYMKTN